MGDPDREEPSADDVESEPESDRSDDPSERTESTDESEPTSYDLDESGLFPDPESIQSAREADERDEDDKEGDESEDTDGETDEQPINEGTSPRPARRSMRPKRENKDEGDDDGAGEDEGDADGDDGGEDAEDDDAKDDDAEDDDAVSNGAGGVTTTQDEEALFEGPDSDEEMPLADHIEEMMRRLGVVFLVAGIATLIAYPSADIAINYFWSSHIPDPGVNRPRVYGPLEFILTKLKVAGIAGVIFGLPVFVYETYLFMRPGLYPRERRYYLAAIPTSLVLGTIGALFAHFLVLPAIFAYFTAYTEGTAVIAFGLAETFNLIVILIAYMAVVFQIPLLIMLAIMMNLVTRQWLEDKRLLFWGGFLGLSWLVTPDPTGMAPIIVTLTMIGLYEGTLALLRWTGN